MGSLVDAFWAAVKAAEKYQPPQLTVAPEFAALGFSANDFPLKDPDAIRLRAFVEGFPLPYCSGNKERRATWPQGVPTFWSMSHAPFSTREQNGYSYARIGGDYVLVADHGTWHGEPAAMTQAEVDETVRKYKDLYGVLPPGY